MKSLMSAGGFFILLALLSPIVGVVAYRGEQNLLSTYEPATATVQDWIPDPYQGATGYCPVYEYRTKAGDTRSFTGSDCVG